MAERTTIRALRTALETVQRMSLRCIEGDYSVEQLTFHVGHSKSNIVWLVGHLATSYDRVVNPGLGVKPSLPDDLAAKFSFGVEPSDIPADYPPFDQLLAHLQRRMEIALSALDEMTDEAVHKPLPEGSMAATMFKSLERLIAGTMFHLSYHTGQISMLRRAQGMKSGLGM